MQRNWWNDIATMSREVGVHIAVLTHFVPVNSLTDLEGRATTVYLASRWYNVLSPVSSA